MKSKDMKSKEEIRNKWIYQTPLISLPEAVDNAMEEYASKFQASPAAGMSAEEMLKDNAFMNGGNTESEKVFYRMGFTAGVASQQQSPAVEATPPTEGSKD